MVEAVRVHELTDAAEAAADDPLIAWAAQGDSHRVRAFRYRDAIAVASPDLSCRDRLAVAGDVDDLGTLVPQVLEEVGPTYRPIGAVATVTGMVSRVPRLALVDRFGWMDTTRPTGATRRAGVAWLEGSDARGVASLLDAAFPSSYARPGVRGVRRWAGRRDCAGRLAAVAADAWSAPTVGFVAGVAAHPTARGRGHGAATCAFLIDALVAEYGRAGLLVDGWNWAAIRLYRRLGLRWRPLAAARVTG